jgi:transcription termination/antitermination protein NusG
MVPNSNTAITENAAESMASTGKTASKQGAASQPGAGVAMSKKWYVIQAYSGQEARVKETLLQRIKESNKEALFGEVLIPTETVQQANKSGQQQIKQKTSYPGYIFVEMEMSEEAWHLVKNTPKVTGFIGNQKPMEVKPPQIDDLRKSIVEGTVKPKARVSFDVGDEIRVTEGPFSNFAGTVEEVHADKQKLRVKVSIFGRATPVELDFAQVEKRTS